MSESPTEHIEHAEHAEHAAHSGDPVLARVSVLIAILAVMAATVGSFETVESGLAITDKNESVLQQNRASDAWAFFQAQTIKKNLYDLAAADAADPGRKASLEGKARQYEEEGAAIRAKAEDFEKERDAKLEDSTGHEKRHHWLTAAVTLLHVSIAVATLTIILRGRRWPWRAAILLAAIGAAAAAAAYL